MFVHVLATRYYNIATARGTIFITHSLVIMNIIILGVAGDLPPLFFTLPTWVLSDCAAETESAVRLFGTKIQNHDQIICSAVIVMARNRSKQLMLVSQDCM